uniref:NADH-ubiquinone oxidoreductase chain 6 n=1 Tax=Dianemobius furumagiensis TaxID=2153487 RepID=A0A6B9VWW0_9ORTH|nr:NADH dehydrogenase subunit 6 [Dianemobius furumagiensis]QHQ73105.1 NADH dehydrogenase subunit 6 [Dianemobius furumagiensis]
MKLILMIMISANSILLMLNHPLSLTIIIIIQSLSICLFISIFTYSSWFSYILFLSFLGGMLVIFIYMTTLASNELMIIPKTPYLIFIFINSLIIVQYVSIFPFNPIKNNDKFLEPFDNINQLFMSPNMMIYFLMILYLLITMIAVIKISNFSQGTLRHSTYE